ncbi:hypothetical protein NLX85_08710 [Micromonospora sp. A3M-1-15]|uniref:hypothetical protein n=1 Tax=Micromonospora sp. A3M-1-15 TaxID=2962035 RepID=UPI0020B764DC|nr:hypothetical protein [Micromonospora sp. A3M-1-15]MCP3783442.1 hypothetical protein [Micromonospora sp. A3M-1-15]
MSPTRHAPDRSTEDELVRLAIRAVAPEEEHLLPFLEPAYRRRPGRWRRDPRALTRVGGGEAGGGGFAEVVEPVLPYVMVLCGVGLAALRDALQGEATDAVRGGLRAVGRRWRSRRPAELAPVRLRPGQLLRIEEAVTAAARDPRWQLTEDQVAVLRDAVREAFAARFGTDADGG